jgi:hypothetical protein
MPRGFDQVRQLRYRLCLPAVIGLPVLSIYDTVRSNVWRQADYGPERLRQYVLEGDLAAQVSNREISVITGVGHGRVYEHLKSLLNLGWLKKERVYGKGGAEGTIYTLGNVRPDLGGGTETWYADLVMEEWYAAVDASAQESLRTSYRKLTPEQQVQRVKEYLFHRYPFLLETLPSRRVNKTRTPTGGSAVPLPESRKAHDTGDITPSGGNGISLPESRKAHDTGDITPSGGNGIAALTFSKHAVGTVFLETQVTEQAQHICDEDEPLPPLGVGHYPHWGQTKTPLNGAHPRKYAAKSVNSPATYIALIDNSSTTLRSTLRTSYSESSCTPCSSSGLAPLITDSSSAPDRQRHDAPTTHPVPLAPPSFVEQVEGGCVIGTGTDGGAMAWQRRTETGSGATNGPKMGFGRYEGDGEAPRAVSARPPPRGLEGRVSATPAPAPKVRLSSPRAKPEPKTEAAVPAPVVRPKTASEGIDQLVPEIEAAKERTRQAHTEAMRKEQSKKQKRANLGSDKSYAAQKTAAQEVEQVWREEMRVAFPDLPQIAWFKREGFKLVARKEGKLAADLLDGYGGDVGVVSAMVESFLRNWDVFGPMLTKQDDSIPTFGLLYACHASVAAESIKLRKRSEVIERYQAWERENAGNAFAVPPAELEAAYRAATTKPKGKR